MDGVVRACLAFYLFFSRGAFSFNFGVEAYEKLADAMAFFLYRVCHVNIQANELTQYDWPCSNFFILFFPIFFFCLPLGHSVAARTKTERADSSGISLFIIIFIYDMRTFNSANMSSRIFSFHLFRWLATFFDVGQLFFFFFLSFGVHYYFFLAE